MQHRINYKQTVLMLGVASSCNNCCIRFISLTWERLSIRQQETARGKDANVEASTPNRGSGYHHPQAALPAAANMSITENGPRCLKTRVVGVSDRTFPQFLGQRLDWRQGSQAHALQLLSTPKQVENSVSPERARVS